MIAGSMKRAFTLLSALGLSMGLTSQAAPPKRLDFTKSCYSSGCHEDTITHKNLHPEVKKKACKTCHKPVGDSVHTFKPIKTPDDCIACHKDFAFLKTMKNVPPQQSECLLCHNIHGTEHDNRLAAPQPQLCYQCHPGLKKGVEEDLYTHGDAMNQCTKCHDIHRKKNLPHDLNAPVKELCMSCHTPIKELSDKSQNDHQAITLDDSCTNCHKGHSSDIKHLLKAEPKTLCLQCHGKEIKRPNKVVHNVAQELKDNPVHHSPIDDGNCSGCHSDAHGGNNPFRLKKNTSSDFYVKKDSDQLDLCFLCHEPDMLDPKLPNATAFRNGERNMHSIHVTRKKNRRNCRVCHEHHASKQTALVSDDFEFGPKNWKVKLEFTPTKTGGSCSPGCHKAFSYDRNKEIQNIPPLKPGRN